MGATPLGIRGAWHKPGLRLPALTNDAPVLLVPCVRYPVRWEGVLLRVLQLEPRGPSFGLGAPIGISVGFLNSSRRGGDEGQWCCVTFLCDVLLAMWFDNSASVLVECGA